jgi:hypothetical protein
MRCSIVQSRGDRAWDVWSSCTNIWSTTGDAATFGDRSFESRPVISPGREEAVRNRAVWVAMQTNRQESEAFSAARLYAAIVATLSWAPRTSSGCRSLSADVAPLPGLKVSGNARTQSQALHDSKPKPAAL